MTLRLRDVRTSDMVREIQSRGWRCEEVTAFQTLMSELHVDYGIQIAGRRSYRVLEFLFLHRHRLCNRREIEDHVWGDEADGGPLDMQTCVYVHICRLRQRLRGTPYTISKSSDDGWQFMTERLAA